MQQLVFNMHFPMWPFFEANVRPPIFYAAFSDHCHINRELIFKKQQIIPRSQCYPDSRLFRFVHDITLDFHSIPRVRRLPIGVSRGNATALQFPLWLFSCKLARIWICFYWSKKKNCSKKMIQNEFLSKPRGVQIQIHCPNHSHGTITTLSILGKQQENRAQNHRVDIVHKTVCGLGRQTKQLTTE